MAKENHISYYSTGVIVCYDLSVVSTVKQPTGSDIIYAVNIGVNSFNALVLFYLSWELDGHYQPNVSIERNRT